MRILGFIFLSLLISVAILFIHELIGGSFLYAFLDNGFVETYATLVGLNLAAVIFLLAQLLSIEEKHSNEIFRETKNEIKHNSLYLLFSLPVSILILILRPELIEPHILRYNPFFFLANLIVILLFVLAVFAIFEILSVIFKINKRLFSDKSSGDPS